VVTDMSIVAVVFGILGITILFALWMSDRERCLHDWRRLRTVLVFFVLVFLSLLSSRLIKRLAERYSWDFVLEYRIDILLFVVSLLASVAIETVRYKASQADTQSGS
jgi:membrane-anchored protein YejM (alkaline phosphatase superfamily)